MYVKIIFISNCKTIVCKTCAVIAVRLVFNDIFVETDEKIQMSLGFTQRPTKHNRFANYFISFVNEFLKNNIYLNTRVSGEKYVD